MSLIASIPSPDSGSIELGPLRLNAYGLMIALGVVVAVWIAGRRLERSGAGTREDVSSVAVWAVPAGVIGARLYHVVTDWDRFSDAPGDIVRIWEGGLGIPGGIALGVLVGWWVTRRRGVDMAAMLTAVAPAIPVAQAIGRWGNWFNQELFGRPTDVWWALEVSDSKAIGAGYPAGTTFHPTFLYESLWNLALAAVLVVAERRFRIGPGRLFAWYVLGYGIGRFWVEGLRIDRADEWGGLRLNQWMAVVIVLAATASLVLLRRRPVPAAEDDSTQGVEAASVEARGVKESASARATASPAVEGGVASGGPEDGDEVESEPIVEEADRPRSAED